MSDGRGVAKAGEVKESASGVARAVINNYTAFSFILIIKTF